MTPPRWFGGIDPGASGAVAVVDRHGEEAFTWPAPADPGGWGGLLAEVVASYPLALAAVEKVGAHPGQGVVSMFTFGAHYGAALGALEALGVPLLLVSPQRWQKALLDPGGGDTKARSLATARRRFPALDLARKKDHGRADAALLSLYARREGLIP